MAAKEVVLTYVGGGGARIIGVLRFERGEPTEVSASDAKAILEGPHAGEFFEGEPDPEVLGAPFVVAGPGAGSQTDTTGDVPAPDEAEPGEPPAPEPDNAAAKSARKEA